MFVPSRLSTIKNIDLLGWTDPFLHVAQTRHKPDKPVMTGMGLQ